MRVENLLLVIDEQYASHASLERDIGNGRGKL
jgi:hypothetical protein